MSNEVKRQLNNEYHIINDSGKLVRFLPATVDSVDGIYDYIELEIPKCGRHGGKIKITIEVDE